MPGVFITGTDTGIGKTHVTLACLQALRQNGIKVAGMKPVASGAQMVNGQLRNEDALLLQQAMELDVPYGLINPYCFEPSVSPHIAAQQLGVEIDLQVIKQNYQQLADKAGFVIVEGVGGWLAPLSNQISVADMAQALNLPVVLVVGIRLGCLNHASLSFEMIKNSGVQLAGWVANHLQTDMQFATEQIEYLSQQFGYSPMFVMQQKIIEKNFTAEFAANVSASLRQTITDDLVKVK